MKIKKSGYTLLETIAVLAIIAILVTAATAAVAQRLALARADADENRLYRMLLFARQSAVLRGTAVIFCGRVHNSCISRGGRETAVLSTGADGAAESLLQGARLADTEAWLEFRGAFGAGQLRFAPDGAASGAGSWIYCPGSGREALRRRVVVNPAGRIYPAGDRDGDGRKDGTQGADLCRPSAP